MKIVIATHNKGKLNEFKQLLNFEGVTLLSLSDLGLHDVVEETGSTFLENAFIKARCIHEMTKLPCIADDSGLEVEALNQAPGIYSARYSEAGDDLSNNQKLLTNLTGITHRSARFVCALAYVDAYQERSYMGYLSGKIALEMRGSNGFGYDSLFLVNEDQTLAEIPESDKNAISHRANAVKQLREEFHEIIDFKR